MVSSIRVKLIALVLFLAAGSTALANPRQQIGYTQKEMSTLANMIHNFTALHVKQPPINSLDIDAIIEAYFESLDSQKMMFFDAEVDEIKKTLRAELPVLIPGATEDFGLLANFRAPLLYNSSMGEATRMELLAHVVFYVGNQYIRRASEMYDIQLSILEEDFDFSKNESLPADLSTLEWPRNERQRRAKIKKVVKNHLIESMLNTGSDLEKAKARYKKLIELSKRRVNNVEADEIVSFFLNSMALVLDPHTTYLPQRAKENQQRMNEGEYAGIGINLGYDLDNERVIITNVYQAGPAGKAGIEKDDAIEGFRAKGKGDRLQDATDMDVEDFSKSIRDKKGVEVCIVVKNYEKNTDARELCMVRDNIKTAQETTKLETYQSNGKTIGVLKIKTFYHNPRTSKGLTDDVRALLQKQKVDALIVDLRFNLGGSLLEAQHLTGLFMDGGPIVKIVGNGQIQRLMDLDPGEYYDMPLMVLTNSYSASASEIFAAAVKDYNRGIIVGSKTYGKGTVQQMYNTQTGSAFKVTTHGFYRVTGKSTQFGGVEPDIRISQYMDNFKGERTLETAIELESQPPMSYKPLAPLDQRKISQMQANSRRRVASNIIFSKMEEARERNEALNAQPLSLVLDVRKGLQKQIESFNNSYENRGDSVLEEAKNIMNEYL